MKYLRELLKRALSEFQLTVSYPCLPKVGISLLFLPAGGRC